MKYSGYIIVPPYQPVKIVALTNKTSFTLKLRKSGWLGACLDDESIYLTENREVFDQLIQGETITL